MARPKITHEPPTNEQLEDDPSMIYVEGKQYILGWPPAKRRRFSEFIKMANEFGLHVVEIPAAEIGGIPKRRRWTHVRVDVLGALARIHDQPGILFDDWVGLWIKGDQITPVVRREARKKAATALHRLYHMGHVEKRKRPDDGRMELYPIGNMPISGFNK